MSMLVWFQLQLRFQFEFGCGNRSWIGLFDLSSGCECASEYDSDSESGFASEHRLLIHSEFDCVFDVHPEFDCMFAI